ncbi:hypothetical protein Tco_0152844 [Tanacetum coccineum]
MTRSYETLVFQLFVLLLDEHYIDGHEKLITKDSLRRHLMLDDAEGISSLSNEEIFEHLAHIGYVVPTGRVVVPSGRYVVPAGKVIIIVSPGRLNIIPTGRILSPGKVK